ncbi:MAG: dTMP kinase [Oscillospiraceae bacterium]|jgi:dTMP kinase
MQKGNLIVIEGLDGSGKATQCGLICEDLEKLGKKVKKLSFPRYNEESSALVRMYLGGKFGDDPRIVNAYAASTFFAVDRYASYMTDWKDDYAAGSYVVTDRYTTSNAVYQTSKMPRDKWDSFLDWLMDFEFNKMGIPAPDLVIMLDVTEDVSEKLMEKRYAGDESRMDIDERDIDYQHDSREAANFCAEKFGWKTVSCCSGGAMRPVGDIHREIMKLLGDYLS